MRERALALAVRARTDLARLVFAPQIPQAERLARLRLADLLLDTWPYNAHTTASDALWVGLPVIALQGNGFAARVSSSVLRAAGLSELIAESLSEYEALVFELCSQPERLRDVRRRVESRVHKSPLFDTARFTRALEAAYEHMWRRCQASLPPASFCVAR